jgi:hypothetical protein
MLTLALLAGLWSSNCTMTQTMNQQGFARETYALENDGAFEQKRTWYVDAICSVEREEEVLENGTLELGKKLSGIFISSPTFEANFNGPSGTDLGVVSSDGKILRLARGMKNSSMRNTMLGFIEFIKQ